MILEKACSIYYITLLFKASPGMKYGFIGLCFVPSPDDFILPFSIHENKRIHWRITPPPTPTPHPPTPFPHGKKGTAESKKWLMWLNFNCSGWRSIPGGRCKVLGRASRFLCIYIIAVTLLLHIHLIRYIPVSLM